MATDSRTLAWKILWAEEPGRLQSMGSLRVGHDWATSLSLFLSCIGEGNGNPLQCSCLENPRDGRAWWAAVYGVAQSRTRLKRLSSRNKRGTQSVLVKILPYVDPEVSTWSAADSGTLRVLVEPKYGKLGKNNFKVLLGGQKQWPSTEDSGMKLELKSMA